MKQVKSIFIQVEIILTITAKRNKGISKWKYERVLFWWFIKKKGYICNESDNNWVPLKTIDIKGQIFDFFIITHWRDSYIRNMEDYLK